MKQIKTPETFLGSLTTTGRRSAGLLTGSKMLLSIALLLLIQLCPGKASAVALPTTAFSCTIGTIATGSCVSGFYATFGTSSTNYWQYTFSSTGYSSLTMTFQTSSSSTGPNTGMVYYNIGAGDVLFTSYSAGSCGTRSFALPTACNNRPSVIIKLKMSGGTGGAGTNRVNSNGGFNGTATPSCGTPTSGSVVASPAVRCGAGTSTLTLTPGSTGSGISYQWYSGSTLVSGATNLTYVPTVSTTTTYNVVTTCSAGGSATATATVTVNSLPATGTITPVSSPLIVGSTTTVTVTGGAGGGVWTSSNPATGTITSTTGVFSAISGGTTRLTYTVTDAGTGCANSAFIDVNVVWSNTLALYVGTGGTSNTVIPVANESVSTITATGFGTTTACGSGGLSGLTVPTTVATYVSTNPRVRYTITPSTGYALNVYSFYVKSYSSSTGPTKARLAYRIGAGAWVSEGIDHILTTGGSCGSSPNAWYWTLPAALSGITSNIEVAIFPYAPTSASGTFQVNQLEVIGVVSSSVTCTGTPTAGTLTPASTVSCMSGYASLGFSGAAGVGISYSWQQNTGSGWVPISGASSISYTSPTYTVVPTSIDYRVITSCSSSSLTATSPTATFSITPAPSSIAGMPAYLEVGSTATLSTTPGGGVWSSQNGALASIGSSSGDVTGVISGTTTISYTTAGMGCYVVKTVNVIQPGSLSVYLGAGGSSTTVIPFGSVSVSTLTATGFTTSTPCASGGLSGLTVATIVATYSSASPNVVYTMTAPVTGVYISGIHATVRSSGSGPASFRIAYQADGGPWVENTSGLAADLENCGVSVNDNVHDVVPFGAAGTVKVGIFPYAPVLATGTFQVNSIDIVGYECAANLDIDDLTTGNYLDGEFYAKDCNTALGGPIQLDCFPAGGTWSSTYGASINPLGEMTLDNTITADVVVTITYTNLCNVAKTATINVLNAAGSVCSGYDLKPGTPGTTVNDAVTNVTIYPNPTSNTLNIAAGEKISVSILSMEGKSLIRQENATSVNVSNLASGLYLIQVYNEKNRLIKTAKFTKN